jgi:hypothetical protein
LFGEQFSRLFADLPVRGPFFLARFAGGRWERIGV